MKEDEGKLGVPYNPFEKGFIAEDSNPPADGGTPPADGGNPPADGGNPPADGGNPPADGGGDIQFDTEFFNKTFSTEFKGQDDIKSVIETAKRAKDMELRVAELEKIKGEHSDLQEKYEAYKRYEEGFSPLQYFASEDDYKVQAYMKDNKGKDFGVTRDIFTTDLKGLSDMDVLVKYEKFNDPTLEGGEAGIRELLADRYGIEAEDINSPDSWSTVVKNKIRKEANLARKEFEEIKGSVQVPENVDVNKLEGERKAALAKKKEENQKAWKDITDLMLKDLDKIAVKDDPAEDGTQNTLVEFVLNDKMKDELRKGISDYLDVSGLEPTEENIRDIGGVMYNRVLLQNITKIMKTYSSDLLAKQEDAHNKEINNPQKPKTDVPAGDDDEKNRVRQFALGDIYPSVRNPKKY